MVELLLKAGADPNLALPGGETPLMTAARTGALGRGEGAPCRTAPRSTARTTGRGQTALMWAAAEGHAAVVQALIAAGADVQCALPSGLHAVAVRRPGRPPRRRARAARRPARTSTRRFRSTAPAGAAMAVRLPRAGTSALLLAVMNAHFELAAELLDAGANPNADLHRLHRPPRDHRRPQARHRRQRSGRRRIGDDDAASSW